MIVIIDYPLCTVEKTKKWSKKLKQRLWTTSKFGWTTFVPVSFQFLPVYFQFTSSLPPVFSCLLPVFIQTPVNFQEYIFVSNIWFSMKSLQIDKMYSVGLQCYHWLSTVLHWKNKKWSKKLKQRVWPTSKFNWMVICKIFITLQS